MAVRNEVKKIGKDFFKGLRFGLGGLPSIPSPPYRKIKLKSKKKRRR